MRLLKPISVYGHIEMLRAVLVGTRTACDAEHQHKTVPSSNTKQSLQGEVTHLLRACSLCTSPPLWYGVDTTLLEVRGYLVCLKETTPFLTRCLEKLTSFKILTRFEQQLDAVGIKPECMTSPRGRVPRSSITERCLLSLVASNDNIGAHFLFRGMDERCGQIDVFAAHETKRGVARHHICFVCIFLLCACCAYICGHGGQCSSSLLQRPLKKVVRQCGFSCSWKARDGNDDICVFLESLMPYLLATSVAATWTSRTHEMYSRSRSLTRC